MMQYMSESIDQLAPALHLVQGEIEAAAKDAKNTHFKSNYASYTAVDNAIRPIAHQHGLMWTHGCRATELEVSVLSYDESKHDDSDLTFSEETAPEGSPYKRANHQLNKNVYQRTRVDGYIVVVMHLIHTSGQWMRYEMSIPIGLQGGPQSAVGALTFGRRYLLKAMFAMVEEDDDGESLHGRGYGQQVNRNSRPRPTYRAGPMPSPGTTKPEIEDMIRDASSADGLRGIWAKHITPLAESGDAESKRLGEIALARFEELKEETPT